VASRGRALGSRLSALALPQVQTYRARASGSQQQVGLLRRRYEDVKAELSENETYRVLEANEARLRK
jgi:hypothetical protein